MNKLISLLSIGLLLSCGGVSDPALNAPDILAQALEAHGGEEALRAISSQKEEGTTIIYLMDTIYRSSQFFSLEKKGGKSYYETPIKQPKYSKQLVFASDGVTSWTQNDGALAPYKMPQEEARGNEGEDYPYLLTLAERGIETKYIETVEDKGSILHRVDYTRSDGKVEEVYFNSKTFLIQKIRRFIETSQGTAESIRYLRDYRPVAGTMMPFRTESYFPPRELDLHLINNLELNIPIDDEAFEFPTPHTFSEEELATLVGEYRTSEGELIVLGVNDGVFTITRDDVSQQPLLLVDKNLMMYRVGVGEGSWMANVFIRRNGSRPMLEIRFREETERARKE